MVRGRRPGLPPQVVSADRSMTRLVRASRASRVVRGGAAQTDRAEPHRHRRTEGRKETAAKGAGIDHFLSRLAGVSVAEETNGERAGGDAYGCVRFGLFDNVRLITVNCDKYTGQS